MGSAVERFEKLFAGGGGEVENAEEWSEAELSRLKRNYHRVKRGELNAMFPNRTPSAVNNKIYRLMKDGELARKKARVRVDSGGLRGVGRNLDRRVVPAGSFAPSELRVLQAGSLEEAHEVARKIGVRVSSVRRFYKFDVWLDE